MPVTARRWASSMPRPCMGGVALYLAGHLLFKQRMYAALSVPRLVTVGALLLALPGAAFLPPLVGLAGLVLLLGVLIIVETRRYAALRGGVYHD
jgi:hypothetical protein